MSRAQLIRSETLRQRLKQGDLVILDCRFALDDPRYGLSAYQNGHLPGAHYLDLEQDLSAPVQPGVTGRHPLPDPDLLARRLRDCGVNHDSEIVVYDDGPGAFAARAWWLLMWLGKRDGVYLLDGGLKAWQASGGELTGQPAPIQSGTFVGQPDNRLLIDAQTLQTRLNTATLTLLDARAEARFRGEVEPLDPVAGHIPGAQCAVFTENLDADGHFLPPQALRERFDALRDERPVAEMVAYCGSGVPACHNLFAMSLAGYPLIPLYAGSWSEWITNPQRPVARGN